jgi:dTMP kinase
MKAALLGKGYFIVFEGSDGSGKSTQAKLLHRRLLSDGYDSVLTEEPGGTVVGREIRNLILNPQFKLSPKAELFLFLADRAEHLHKVVRPHLKAGKVVVCSRYFYSTLVYQGIARKLAPLDYLEELNLFSVDAVQPELVFYLDIHPEEGLSKAKGSKVKAYHTNGGDRIEQEGVEFQTRVREGYLTLFSGNPEKFVVLDGSKSIDDIGRAVYLEAKRRLNLD